MILALKLFISQCEYESFWCLHSVPAIHQRELYLVRPGAFKTAHSCPFLHYWSRVCNLGLSSASFRGLQYLLPHPLCLSLCR